MRLLILLLIALLAALQYRLWVGAGSIADLHGMQQEIDAQRLDLERLRTRNQELQAEVEDLRTGEAALEERARGELGMIKAGEAFIQVIERPKVVPEPAPESPSTKPAHGKSAGPDAKPKKD
jgi:cell division protein FtsB